MGVLPKRAVLELPDYPMPAGSRHEHIRLDSGEHTVGFPESYPSGLKATDVSAYPEYCQLQSALGRFWAVGADQILLTNGSDTGLSLIAQTFIEPGIDAAVVCQPSFIVIPRSLKLAGARLINVPVTAELRLDDQTVEQALATGVKACFLASPDNPLGTTVAPDVVQRWCAAFPETLFVIDEAYFEYSGLTVMPLIEQADNLLVTRTFSKAWGMAGLRLGAVVGNAGLLRYLLRVRLPFEVNGAAVRVALELLGISAQIQASTADTMRRKAQLVQRLTALGLCIFDSPANFFLLDFGQRAAAFTEFCRDSGLLVRNCSPPPGDSGNACLAGKVRISAGTEFEHEALLRLVEQFLCREVAADAVSSLPANSGE